MARFPKRETLVYRHSLIPFGRYAGKSLRTVYLEDKGYYSWLSREGILPHDLKQDIRRPSDEPPVKLCFMEDTLPGGQTISEVMSSSMHTAKLLCEAGYFENGLMLKVAERYHESKASKTDSKLTSKIKGESMTTDKIKSNVIDESQSNLQLQVGKVIYTSVTSFIETKVLKLTLLQKLLTTKKNRELAVMGVLYTSLHLLRSKYDHYALECLSKYINHKAQSDLVTGVIDTTVIAEILKMPKSK